MDEDSTSKIAELIEEVAEGQTGLMVVANRVAEAQAALRAEFAREMDALREDFAGALAYRTLKDLCRELATPLAAMEAMLAQADFADPALIRGHVESLAITVRSVMSRMGAEKIPVSPGEEVFSPDRHLCHGVVAPEASPFPGAPPRTVIRIVEDGYTLAGRMLSPARVEVQGEKKAILPENCGPVAAS